MEIFPSHAEVYRHQIEKHGSYFADDLERLEHEMEMRALQEEGELAEGMAGALPPPRFIFHWRQPLDRGGAGVGFPPAPDDDLILVAAREAEMGGRR